MSIQWFPGHMAKAKRELLAQIKCVDIVFELLDARLPFSSHNPILDSMLEQKPILLVINKADMADKIILEQWEQFFKAKGRQFIFANAKDDRIINKITKEAQFLLAPKLNALKLKGIRPRSMRAMVVGIPNVGKSTLINRVAKKNIARTGNKPGVTKAQQWIKLNPVLDLLDTPGILWPKFADPEIGYKLALSGAIKDDILNLHDVAYYGLQFLAEMYPNLLYSKYQIKLPLDQMDRVFVSIGQKLGYFAKEGIVDINRTVVKVIQDFRSLRIGKICLETPTSINGGAENK